MERLESPKPVQSESAALPIEPARKSEGKRASSKLTEWQRFFLDRLDYLIGRQRNGEGDVEEAALLSKAIYSTYLDCQTQGVGEQALALITSNSATKPSAN